MKINSFLHSQHATDKTPLATHALSDRCLRATATTLSRCCCAMPHFMVPEEHETITSARRPGRNRNTIATWSRYHQAAKEMSSPKKGIGWRQGFLAQSLPIDSSFAVYGRCNGTCSTSTRASVTDCGTYESRVLQRRARWKQQRDVCILLQRKRKSAKKITSSTFQTIQSTRSPTSLPFEEVPIDDASLSEGVGGCVRATPPLRSLPACMDAHGI
ncbi:hypothetical protein HDK90DRAFT_171208 [Phyllosticta capitalensis]|uniref:Uncharacterized protein n=1 Tax=Phyllosticta capitalensis TaxID=121624 RepID=A0ABR1YV47_9PEZI